MGTPWNAILTKANASRIPFYLGWYRYMVLPKSKIDS